MTNTQKLIAFIPVIGVFIILIDLIKNGKLKYLNPDYPIHYLVSAFFQATSFAILIDSIIKFV